MRRFITFASWLNGMILALLLFLMAMRPTQPDNPLKAFMRYMPGQALPNCEGMTRFPDSDLCTLQEGPVTIFMTARAGVITVMTLHTVLPAGAVLVSLGPGIVTRGQGLLTFCYDHAKAIMRDGDHWHDKIVYVSFTRDEQVC